ncbi:MAG: rod shape-determining protein RodA [Armatimonadetes bacterium]|nr:rod shape-determining protein RodA [Armatimonadota bacterium]MDW8122490.1 rod shape-determining protein RodA [Armatimonadota bacterium]
MLVVAHWRRWWLGTDWWLFAVLILLQAFGLLALASASYPSAWGRFFRQVIWMFFGFLAYWLAFRSDLNQWLRWSRFLYRVNLALLILVLAFGEERYGAQRWLSIGPVTFQPSEFAKPLLIISLASFFAQWAGQTRDRVLLIRSGLYVALPFVLVFLQPDFGTALILLAIWFGMLFLSGVSFLALTATVLSGLLLFSVAWQKGVIKDYQKDRIIAFLDPYSRARREGYHILQAQLAIGSGGLWGTGLFQGRMGKLGFIPAQRTDFIFTVVCEEFGFVGASVTVALFAFLLFRLFLLMSRTSDPFAAFLVAGTFFYVFAHFFVNVGMNLRLMPITGLPLPFFSAGGSNLVATYFLLGLVQMIAARPKRLAAVV